MSLSLDDLDFELLAEYLPEVASELEMHRCIEIHLQSLEMPLEPKNLKLFKILVDIGVLVKIEPEESIDTLLPSICLLHPVFYMNTQKRQYK